MAKLVPGSNLDKNFCSPFRSDRGPGCWLSWWNGVLYYHDPKDPLRNGKDVISLWMIENKVQENQALLDLMQNKNFVSPHRLSFAERQKRHSTPPYLSVQVRGWEDYDDAFWTKIGLTVLQLEKGSPVIKPLLYEEYFSKKFRCLVKRYSTREEPLYGFFFPSGRIKVYAPYSKHKWAGNSTAEDIYHFHFDNSIAFVTSGCRDGLSVHRGGFSGLAQNGEMYGLGESLKTALVDYDTIYVGLDNDETGRIYTYQLAKEIKEAFPLKDVYMVYLEGFNDYAEAAEKPGFVTYLKITCDGRKRVD